MGGWEDWYTLLFQTVLIRGAGITGLVNTGPARDLGPMNEKWKTVLGERSALSRADDEFIVNQLDRHVRDCADIIIPLYDPKNLDRFTDGRVA